MPVDRVIEIGVRTTENGVEPPPIPLWQVVLIALGTFGAGAAVVKVASSGSKARR